MMRGHVLRHMKIRKRPREDGKTGMMTRYGSLDELTSNYHGEWALQNRFRREPPADHSVILSRARGLPCPAKIIYSTADKPR